MTVISSRGTGIVLCTIFRRCAPCHTTTFSPCATIPTFLLWRYSRRLFCFVPRRSLWRSGRVICRGRRLRAWRAIECRAIVLVVRSLLGLFAVVPWHAISAMQLFSYGRWCYCLASLECCCFPRCPCMALRVSVKSEFGVARGNASLPPFPP
jgi:hypothetical protein